MDASWKEFSICDSIKPKETHEHEPDKNLYKEKVTGKQRCSAQKYSFIFFSAFDIRLVKQCFTGLHYLHGPFALHRLACQTKPLLKIYYSYIKSEIEA